MLWTAPELLRTNNNAGSQEGDIYSLGIIGSELVTRKPVYDLENRTEKPEGWSSVAKQTNQTSLQK